MFSSRIKKSFFAILCTTAIMSAVCPYIVKADGSGIAESGKFNVSFSDTSGKTPAPTVKLRFYKGEDIIDTFGTYGEMEISANISDTDIPTDATAFEIEVLDDNIGYLKQASLEISIPGAGGGRDRDPSKERGFDDDLRTTINPPEDPSKNLHIAKYDFNEIDLSQNGIMLNFEFSNTKNMQWSYDERYRGTDLFVEHCEIFLLDSSGNRLTGTDHNLTIGTEYTFELVPEYGYQIASLTINGYPVVADTSKGVFKFTMSNSNFHLGGSVAPADDIVNASGFITNASIENGNNAANNGNAQMTISDAASIDSQAVNVVSSSEHPEAVASVDIAIDEVISKGDGTYWSNSKTDLSGNVDIAVSLSKEGLSDGQTYSIVREHNGTREELNSVYNITTQKITFASDKFSTYTIIKKDGIPESDINTTTQNKSSSTANSVVNPDPDTYKSELPSKTVLVSYNGTLKGLYDFKAHTTDIRTLNNQALLVDNSRTLLKATNINILCTYGIYPRRQLSSSENGSKQYFAFKTKLTSGTTVYAQCYSIEDKAYLIKGTVDKNGYAVFSDFILRPATTVTLFSVR